MSKHTALVIIDVQLGMFDESNPVYKGDELLDTIKRLIERARGADIPIVFIQHDGGNENSPIHPDKPGWSIHPAIHPEKNDVILRKRHPDAFQETRLQEELEKAGIQKLVIAGIQTDYCVDTTCRRAYSLGYDVTLVEDGHSTWDTEILKAAQIIAHHNYVLGDWFATLKPASGITFK
jgi:nicotinamidase-related amidase